MQISGSDGVMGAFMSGAVDMDDVFFKPRSPVRDRDAPVVRVVHSSGSDYRASFPCELRQISSEIERHDRRERQEVSRNV